jgi:hypothetical protein
MKPEELKKDIKSLTVSLIEYRKNIRKLILEARQEEKTDADRNILRERAQKAKTNKDYYGRKQRHLLLAYAWLRNYRYRTVEGRTLADKVKDPWEARMIRKNLAEAVSNLLPVGRQEVLTWMTVDLEPREVERKLYLEAFEKAEKEVAEASGETEFAQWFLCEVTTFVKQLENKGEESFVLNLARKQKEKAAKTLEKTKALLAGKQRARDRAKEVVFRVD